MALDIRYDADGCEGRLVREEETARPDLSSLAVWVGMAGVLLFSVSLLPKLPLDAQVGAVLLLAGVAVAMVIVLGLEGIVDLAGIRWDTEAIEERFTVRHGQLVLHTAEGPRSAALPGARVRAFDDGVWVNPQLGDPIRLVWDGATRDEVATLTEALQQAASGDRRLRGTSHDVPEGLDRLR